MRQPAAGPVEALLAGYAVYLALERGLAATTVQRGTELVRPFLATRVRTLVST